MAMMETPLNTWLLFGHAPRYFPDTEVVTRLPDGRVHRYTYAEFARRAQQLMHALDALGLAPDDRVATLAWNGYRHLEAYWAVPCTGRVLHTLNLRLSPEDLAYVIGHADDRAILADPDLLPLLEKVHARGGLAGVRHVIVLGDEVPDTALPGVVAYEQLIAGLPDGYAPRDIDERSPLGLCYTSGTTGRPKGVLYTHRSTVLHAIAASSRSAMAIGPGDCVLPVVPMFHANAWGVPYTATPYGAKQVFLSGSLDPVALVELMAAERVTVAAGVPTIWMAVADEITARGGLPSLRHLLCGGARPPRALIERYRRDFGIPLVQVWGMTETSPLASVAWPKERMRDWDEDRISDAVRTRAGLPLPGVQMDIRDEAGNSVAWDGTSMGDLLVRGPWIADSYLGGEGAAQFTQDGWFRTGDIAIGSPDGYVVIADRAKDLIKSGGEWISSVDMESAVMALPEVAEAAVIAVPDDKWQERPLICVAPRPGSTVTLARVRAHLEAGGFARWQLPDRIEVVEAIPRTGVGKFDKKALRARFDS
ncbi:long-chain fatty acid--CoA ligase [Streptomyces sp. NBC_01340]|uniref:long-chain fatty acid--CoA ligase n=1 Tax=unclassified Streptomyces TaxID=2593676 RepID=UPI002254B5AF|nr:MULTISPECIES: long-chain fatty acid--CoA ligase [unclassified Streptomyces]MCX4452087.1 long-chain fatty acid--CoA ligase [Streptomyces sp. NBC_01719]MCX4491447.1 long-chain fatty acid--CoA ligase [Streptomyces sp. NBC_01728]WSI36757.1 long-chain fatty acid--CoA ligase [Streptomyces sp. NBC_01340]